MSTHIILNAVKDVAGLIETFRNQPCKLVLQLGEYVAHETKNYEFIPGISKREFIRLLWYVSSYDEWTNVTDWTQDLEVYWFDPVLLNNIRKQKKDSKTKLPSVPIVTKETQGPEGEALPFPLTTTETSPNQLNFVKGILRGNSEEDMDYEESIGVEKQSDIFCPERRYSFRVKTKTEKPLNADVAAPAHTFAPSYFNIVRHTSFTYMNTFTYRFSIARTGSRTKHETISNGKTSYHVQLELHRNQRLLDAKNNLRLAGDLCEKGIDLLIRGKPYSLEVFKPFLTNFNEVTERRPIEFRDSEERELETKVTKFPSEYIPLVS